MVKTAVLLATYNGEAFIKEQLDSIKNQTCKPDYVLMRDDGSTDETVSLVQSYIEANHLSGWSIVKNEQNLGWRLNFRQLLLDSLSYDLDYVFFSDQDDIWYLDKNERQVAIMENNQSIDVLSADVDIKLMSEDATEPNQFQFDQSSELSQYPLDFTYHNYRQGWTFCIRQSLVESIMKYYSQSLILSHDNLMTGISGLLGSGYNYNSAVGVHKRHGGNASGNLLSLRSTNQRHLDELKLVLSYDMIAVRVLKEVNHPNYYKLLEYLNFNKNRLKNAENRDFFATLKQVIQDKVYYDSFSNRIRDLIFLVKK
ncbi:glycosyltransferase [Streptococcus uberis]|uniref:glycosyltransferase n=1 Tax=Streptococcus uberis TaxID=1349 RepID=UPI000DFEF7EB|nr:glycosyltransferase [Streptococcus uberis]SUO89531.1 Glycosyl transferase, group 2 family protein [Streptococcus uberis]